MSINPQEFNEVHRLARIDLYKQEIIQHYRDQIKKNPGERRYEYLGQNGNKVNRTLFTGAGTGIVIGATCGGLCGIPGGPPGVATGVLAGGVVGGLIGTAIASTIIYYDYRQWEKTEEGKLLGGQIIPFLSDDPILRDYICSISHQIVTDPVRSPEGHIFERKEIEKWLEKSETSPMTRSPLTKEMLQPAYDVTGKVASAMIKLLDEDIEGIKLLDKDFVNGMRHLKTGIEKQRDADFNRETIKLQSLKKQNKITGKELSEGMNKLREDFYPV